MRDFIALGSLSIMIYLPKGSTPFPFWPIVGEEGFDPDMKRRMRMKDG